MTTGKWKSTVGHDAFHKNPIIRTKDNQKSNCGLGKAAMETCFGFNYTVLAYYECLTSFSSVYWVHYDIALG